MAQELEELVVEFLERLERSGSEEASVLAELTALHPQWAEPLRQRVVALREMGLLYLSQEPQPRELPRSLGDFEIEALLGEGGMGVVYRATQRSMRRQVALKLMRPGLLDRPGSRARFAREAEAVARLRHPGIVAVHLTGEEQGIPYLVMEFVPGVSLDHVLRAVAGRNPRELTAADFQRALVQGESQHLAADPVPAGPGAAPQPIPFFSGSWHDACLRVASEIARALAHAHGRGVLHRDVKPSNIMLTPEGRVLLLNFGLASLVGEQGTTRSGSLVGSLPYMAPEQLEGRRGAFDARTDVYGLGVTLYQMLTLKSPHLDPESTERTRSRILEGRPVSPRRLSLRLPKDAESVVMVAMDRDPARRYASAALFAQDLDAVLEHRPILAQPAGTLTHFTRWARRHPGAATAAALVLGIATLGPSLYALQAGRAKQRLEAQLLRADRNYQRSLDALDLVVDVAVGELSDVPMAEPGRRRMLEGAVAFFREAAEEPGSAAEVAVERARAQVRLGDLCEDLGDLTGARNALESALLTFQATAVEAGSPRAADVAGACRLLAGVHERQGDRGRALELIDQGLALVPAGGTDPKALPARANLQALGGKLLRRAGRREEAREQLLALLSENEEQDPDPGSADGGAEAARADSGPLELAAWSHSELSELEGALGDPEARRIHLERALELREALHLRDPKSRVARQQLIVSLSNLGAANLQRGQIDAGLTLLQRAAELGEQQVEAFPGLPDYRFHLSGVLINLGGIHYQRGDLEAARRCMERSRSITSRLLDAEPGRIEYRAHWIAASSNLVAFDLQEKHYAATLERLGPFDTLLAELLEQSPGEQNLVRTVQVNTLNRIRAHWGLKQAAEATRAAARLSNCEDAETLCSAAAELAAVLAFPELQESERKAAEETVFQLLVAAKHRGASTEELLGIEQLEPLRDDPRLRELVLE